jgi:hypothetical protein
MRAAVEALIGTLLSQFLMYDRRRAPAVRYMAPPPEAKPVAQPPGKNDRPVTALQTTARSGCRLVPLSEETLPAGEPRSVPHISPSADSPTLVMS